MRVSPASPADGTASESRDRPGVGDDFIRRALDTADLNALRISLYQATGDASLLTIRLTTTPAMGGATRTVEVAEEERAGLKAKLLAFLQDMPADFAESRPDDAQLRQLMEALRNESLSDKDFAYRRDIPAFDDYPRAARWTAGKPPIPDGFEVAIIGAGLSGIAMAVQLQHLGIPYVIYERRPRVGGTWEINNYPDVRVDVISVVYQYSFEKKYRWSEYFAQGAEVRDYVEHVARKHGIIPQIRFNHEVTAATFDEASGTWCLDIAAGGRTQRRTVNAVVAATGLFAVPKRLEAPGLADYQGTIVHSTEWTGSEQYEGRNVAIIGNGSTGVQMLKPVRQQARQVYVMQRTPQWMTPREGYGKPITPETQWLLDTMPYYWNWHAYSYFTMRLSVQVAQEIDPDWQARGGLISRYNDALRQGLTEYIKTKLAGRPDLVEKVTPKHAPMARRMIADNDWYTALLADNVELVTDQIERLTPGGIRTADGKERPVDLIVAATGFAVTKYLWPTQYRGLGGANLHARWEDPDSQGPRAYLGMTVPGFPNLFIMYGPNSQTRSGGQFLWFETWARYIGEALVALIEGGFRYAAVRPEVFDEYNRRLDEDSRLLIWSDEAAKAKNYYLNSFGRNQVSMPWRVEESYSYFERFEPGDYTFR